MDREQTLALLEERRDQIAFEMIEAEGENYLLLESELSNIELEILNLEENA